MADAFVVTAGMIEKFGRADATFMKLAVTHSTLIDELLAAFDLPQLVDLALKVPDNENRTTLHKVWPVRRYAISGRQRYKTVHETITGEKRATNLAAYIAACSPDAVSKMLTEVEELSRQKLEIIKEIKGLLKLVADGRCPLVLAAMRGDGAAEQLDGIIKAERQQD